MSHESWLAAVVPRRETHTTGVEMKHEFAILGLWLIAILTTAILTEGNGKFTYLGPVFAICAIGSVITVRRAKASGK